MQDDDKKRADDAYHPPIPINLRNPRPPDETGFLIIRLKAGSAPNLNVDLATAADESGATQVSETLRAFSLRAQPLLDSETAARLRKLEQKTANHKFAPSHSLSDYWRVDVRGIPDRVQEIQEALSRLPDVESVYREKSVSNPVMAGDDVHSTLENFLDAAPIGVDARWAWTRPNGDGSGMHFIDLENSWNLDHEDLPTSKLIFNDNDFIFVGDHGTAVIGIVAGVDNKVGIVGIAPNVKSVRLVSYWDDDCPFQQNIYGALAAAIVADPPPHVLLIEAQIGAPELPVETDSGCFNLIRLAVANGIIVIEAAANGDQDLDPHLGEDSGAILVGAAESGTLHNRSIWGQGQGSNFGSRVTCYAWGDSIVSAGFGDLNSGSGNQAYTKTFGGTSGASAIIAGCALLLQGLYVAAHGSPMLPEQMRDLLSNPHTGTAQGTAVPGHIGVMPDLKKIVENM
jgi:subtilisin family serine protease